MLSRSASLDSIVRYNNNNNNNNEYDVVVNVDQEMISRPSSAAGSLREQQPIKFIERKPTIVVKPKQPLETAVTVEKTKTKVTPTAKAVLEIIQSKHIKSKANVPKTNVSKTNVPKTTVIKSPPTISLSQSIAEKPAKKEKKKLYKNTPFPTLSPAQLQRQREKEAKDKKTKQQEQVARLRAKFEDVDMATPLVKGKRRK